MAFDISSLFNIDWTAAVPFDFSTMTPYEFGRGVLLTFILVFIVFWAILEKLRVFPKKVNVILSLGVCILLATTPAFTAFSAYITQISGTAMIFLFGVMLIGGTLAWALGRGRDVFHEQLAPERKLMDLEKKIQKARAKGRMETAEALDREKRQFIYEMEQRRRRRR